MDSKAWDSCVIDFHADSYTQERMSVFFWFDRGSERRNEKRDAIPCSQPTVLNEDRFHRSISRSTAALIRIMKPMEFVLGVASR